MLYLLGIWIEGMTKRKKRQRKRYLLNRKSKKVRRIKKEIGNAKYSKNRTKDKEHEGEQ